MRGIIKYFKPYLPAFLATIIMLYGQVSLELELPNIMSKIVTQGIQQQGMENGIPQALTQETYGAIYHLLPPREKSIFSASYRLLPELASGSIEEGDERLKIAKKFSLLENKAIYYLDSRETLQPLLENQSLRNIICSFSPVEIMEVYKDQALLQILAKEYDRLGYDQGKRQRDIILRLGAKMLSFTLLSAILVIIIGFLAARSAAGMSRSLRGALFKKVQSFSQAEMDSFSTASLITRNTNDITQIQQVVFMVMRIVVFAPLMGIGGLIRALDKAPSMAWLIGLAVLVLLSGMAFAIKLAMPKFRAIQNLVDRVNQMARENLTGLPVVRAFNMESFEEKRFESANQDLTKTNLFVMRVMSMMMPMIGLIMNVLSVAIIWVGAHRIASSNLNVGDIMAFLQYSMLIVFSFMMMTMIFTFLPRAAVSADRISEVLNKKITIKDPENPKILDSRPKGILEFRKVGFRYPGGEENALEDISFTALPGKTTAIIGSTGSGKSTIVKMIPRFYDITEGSLLLDGEEISSLKLSELRKAIAVVPQKNTLFRGTIASNIAYGAEESSEESLINAARTAQAANILEEKENGFEADVSQGGANFSGGQKQRLAIARALASDRQIMIFDDSFSALDFKTDQALRQGLKDQCRDKTLIIIAQRVSTIMQADQIIVLDEGKITGMGTHKELLKSCTTYREIAQSQLNLEELA